MAAEDESLVVMAQYDADTRQLLIDRMAGEVPEGRDLELWVIKEDRVRSLGVIPREAEGVIQVSAELAPDIEGGQLALTDEPLGGSPTGVATGPIVAAGSVTGL
jgi:anti-sigma-K factor RskA